MTLKFATLGGGVSRLKHGLILKFLCYFCGDNWLGILWCLGLVEHDHLVAGESVQLQTKHTIFLD
jgi:hypothetical protein